jgi:hypothetical protein
MLARLYRPRERRPRIRTGMALRLMQLRQAQQEVRRRGLSIVRKVELTPEDRRRVEECISLLYEIEDFAERLQRAGEKWKIYV